MPPWGFKNTERAACQPTCVNPPPCVCTPACGYIFPDFVHVLRPTSLYFLQITVGINGLENYMHING
jgi:hypothetical protein